MRIMFVCTGNVCRSPMAELLLRHYLRGSSIDVCSAGTRGLPGYPIDPSSARLMASVGIAPDAFRSRRLTKTMAEAADLILCFEHRQCAVVASLAPRKVRRIFTLTDFAGLCRACRGQGIIRGLTVQQRLQSVIEAAPLLHASLPPAPDIQDPHGRSFDVFYDVAQQMNEAVAVMLLSMKRLSQQRQYYSQRHSQNNHR